MSDNTEIDWSPPMPDDQMAAAYQSVQAKLTHTAGGEVRNTLQNFVTALTHDPVFAGNIRRNLFKERMSMTCPVWWTRKSDMIDDMDVAFLRLYLEEHYGLRSEKLIYPALNIASTAQAFHPVRDRLNSLVWDGVPRVRVALHHFLGAEVGDTNEKYLRTFMLGAVNRVFHPGCKFELMLVLVGGQGAGKTTFIRFLALEPEWFTDDVSKLDDKEIYHRLNGHWICELSEMVATANAKSIEEIKSFLSKQKETYKVPYETHPADRLRSSPAKRVRRHDQPHGFPAFGQKRQSALSPGDGGCVESRLPYSRQSGGVPALFRAALGGNHGAVQVRRVQHALVQGG